MVGVLKVILFKLPGHMIQKLQTSMLNIVQGNQCLWNRKNVYNSSFFSRKTKYQLDVLETLCCMSWKLFVTQSFTSGGNNHIPKECHCRHIVSSLIVAAVEKSDLRGLVVSLSNMNFTCKKNYFMRWLRSPRNCQSHNENNKDGADNNNKGDKRTQNLVNMIQRLE